MNPDAPINRPGGLYKAAFWGAVTLGFAMSLGHSLAYGAGAGTAALLIFGVLASVGEAVRYARRRR